MLVIQRYVRCCCTGSASAHVPHSACSGVVSAPLWNSEKSRFAGMLTVSDIIHLIQYYYHTATYESAVADVENMRLENLRRELTSASFFDCV